MESDNFDQTLHAVANVPGWMTNAQARLLWDRVANLEAPAQVVEIGSYRGRSAVVLARAARDGVQVTAIDPHAGNDRGPQQIEGTPDEGQGDHEAFLANLERAGVSEKVRHVRAPSHDALSQVQGAIDVLYVDGAHRYGPARDDIARWGERVAPGGTLLIHDSFSSIGVTLAILRQLVPSRRFRYVGRTRSLTEYRADLGGRGRVRNACRQLAQLPWFARNVALKVLLTLGLGKVMRRLGRTVPDWPY